MFYNIFCHFFAKKFGHVKKKQYLCIRNRKGKYLNILRRKRTGQRWGATREGYGAVKNIPAAAGRKSEGPFPISGSSLFRYPIV